MSEIHNIEAEQALLGAILEDNAVMDMVSGTVEAEHFYDGLHARVYEVAASYIAEGKLADPVILKRHFERDAEADGIDWPEYLAELLMSAPPREAAEAYAELIREFADKRACEVVTDEMRARLEDDTAQDAIAFAEARLSEIAGVKKDRRQFTLGAAARIALDEASKPGVRIMTGLKSLDDTLGGFRPGKFYILAGRSSMGKTALGASIARRAAANGFASAFVSIEMPAQEVAARLLSEQSGVPYFDILRNRVHPSDQERVVDALGDIDRIPLNIYDTPGLTPSGLRSILRRWKFGLEQSEQRLGVVVVDFLQLLRAEQGTSAYEKATEIAKALQSLARALEVPIIALSQLARDSEKEKDKRPAIRHLRDSGAIEEAADAIMLVYRDSYYAEREGQSSDSVGELERQERARSKEVEVDIAKNRQGALGQIRLRGNLPTNQFEEMPQ